MKSFIIISVDLYYFIPILWNFLLRVNVLEWQGYLFYLFYLFIDWGMLGFDYFVTFYLVLWRILELLLVIIGFFFLIFLSLLLFLLYLCKKALLLLV